MLKFKSLFVAAILLTAAPAIAQALNDRQRTAVDAFWLQQEECKGGIPGTAEMETACNAREEAQIEMIAAGLCWGHETSPNSYMRTVPCSDPAAYETILGTSLR